MPKGSVDSWKWKTTLLQIQLGSPSTWLVCGVKPLPKAERPCYKNQNLSMVTPQVLSRAKLTGTPRGDLKSQSLLSQIWWGDMERTTEVWKLLLTFFCPFLCYTNFISFREQYDQQQEEEKPSEDRTADTHYGMTVFSYSEINHTEVDSDEVTTPQNTLSRHSSKFYQPPRRPFIVSRWRQFWYAPVTAFLGNVLMYFFFLGLFAYVLLLDFKPPPPSGPAASECVLYFWVFTIVCEEIRQSKCWTQKLRVYIQDMWNKWYLIALTLFIIGSISRMFNRSYEFGRDVLCVDYMVFTLRLIHIFTIHKQLGPKVIIIGKMMKDLFFFLFFLGVWIIAYGVANQGLLYSYDPNMSRILRRVLYRPYLHIFGENFVEEVDVGKEWDLDCTDNVTLIEEGAEPCRSLNNNWLVIVLLALYLLVTNILLINLLIAMFSNTFNEVQTNSDIHWKFQRYNLIVQYHSRPSLAPPFIILSHINLFIRRVIRKVPSVKVRHFVLQLPGKAANRLMTWENIQKEDFLSAQNKIKKSTDLEKLKRMSDKLDNVLRQLAKIRDFDHRLKALENQVEPPSITQQHT